MMMPIVPRKAIPSKAPEYSSWSKISPPENIVMRGKPSFPKPPREYIPEYASSTSPVLSSLTTRVNRKSLVKVKS